jgi:hypothetical protein
MFFFFYFCPPDVQVLSAAARWIVQPQSMPPKTLRPRAGTSADQVLVIRKPKTEMFVTSFVAIRARIKEKSVVSDRVKNISWTHASLELSLAGVSDQSPPMESDR